MCVCPRGSRGNRYGSCVQVDKILKVIPRERTTYLYSATMTKKVAKLQRASLHNPVKIEVSTKYQTVEKLQQYYLFIPAKYKVGVARHVWCTQ